ncbi:acyltransferase [Pedobacter sp. B4-66]|uniref:acyltransferase family protein n=1 Tax=Pedobacter sp. B4-66 TaxID=2817280 RepID=UPI001BD96315|nr:acyltransferase [Pedobacter sp. B4-66]
MFKFLNSLPSKLTRITSGGKLIREIDGLRFIAILPVLVQHFTERFERNTSIDFIPLASDNFISFLAARGFLGVYIFFVISGFVLGLPFAAHKFQGKKEVKIGNYFLRRVTRLEPPYVIWMTLFFLLFVFHKHVPFLTYLPHYLANITYTHALIYNEWSPFNPPTWTLEIEIQFYLLAPFLAMLFFKIKEKYLRRIFNITIILLLVLCQQYFQFFKVPYNFTILGHLQYFLVGFLLADLYLNDWSEISPNTLFDFTGVLALCSLIYFWSWDYELFNRIMVLISLFVFFVSVFKGNYLNRFVVNRWIMAIGGMCYTIYLIHLPFAEFLILLTKKIQVSSYYAVNLFVQLGIFIPIILSISAVFYFYLEKPFMNKDWPKNFYLKLKSLF